MDQTRQREIASKGGRAAHAKGTAHIWSKEEARIAGRKGGELVSQDRLHMSTIGKGGGESRSLALRAARLLRAQEQAAVRAAASAAASAAVERTADRARDRSRERPLERSLERVGRSAEQRDMA